jgi:hypothetical protein
VDLVARLVAVLSGGPALAGGAGAEQLAGLVEQGDVGIGPAHGVDVVGTRPVELGRLVVGEPPRRRQPEQRRRAEEIVQQLGRGQDGPHSLQRLADDVVVPGPLPDRLG